MKEKITIYTNLKNPNFFDQILTNYTLDFQPISNLKNKKKTSDSDIVLIDEINSFVNKSLDIDVYLKNYLLITNSKKIEATNNTGLQIIKALNSPGYFKNKIDKFISSKKITYKNISILDKKIINKNNKKFCFLTDIEKELIIYLIKNRNSSKTLIKKNILNIKSNIETNSLDSHLFRIRKKFEEINANIVVKTKNDNISIFTDQKN